jgi:hypothetical protein
MNSKNYHKHVKHKYVKLYRYDVIQYCLGIDEYGDPIKGIGKIEIRKQEFDIIKHTPKGAWIDNFGTPKFVNLHANKKFACITEKEALISFIRRKQKYLELMSIREKITRIALKKARIIAAKNYNLYVQRYVERYFPFDQCESEDDINQAIINFDKGEAISCQEHLKI